MGPPHQARRRSNLLEGKNPMTYAAQGGWGVGGAALHYYANFPRLLPIDFRIKSEHNRAHDWPISYDDVAPFTTRSRARPASPVMPKPKKDGGRRRGLSDAADEDLPERQHLAQRL